MSLEMDPGCVKSFLHSLGPSRHFAAKQRFGRFQVEADISQQAAPAGSVENAPKPTNAQL
jgi:hypothetical protein